MTEDAPGNLETALYFFLCDMKASTALDSVTPEDPGKTWLHMCVCHIFTMGMFSLLLST